MNALLSRSTRSVACNATKKTKGTGTQRQGGAGYRKYDGDALWLPSISRPEWLDGSLPGDRGFDPLGLAKPGTFVQIGERSISNRYIIDVLTSDRKRHICRVG